jgi:hypothetical protein
VGTSVAVSSIYSMNDLRSSSRAYLCAVTYRMSYTPGADISAYAAFCATTTIFNGWLCISSGAAWIRFANSNSHGLRYNVARGNDIAVTHTCMHIITAAAVVRRLVKCAVPLA